MTTGALFRLQREPGAKEFAEKFQRDIDKLLDEPHLSYVAPVLVHFLEAWARREETLDGYYLRGETS